MLARPTASPAHRGAGSIKIPHLRVALAAACSALFVSAAAHALSIPDVGGIDAVGSDEKTFYVEFGAYFGMDSNVLREEAGEKDDTVLELLGGAALVRGNERSRFDLRVQARSDKYSDLSEYDFTETRALFGAQFDSDKVLASLKAEYATLADPTDIALTDLLERNRRVVVPRADIKFGPKLELGLSYTLRSTEYDDSAYRHLDHENNTFGLEFRWGRRDLQQVFLQYNLGAVEYGNDSQRDFDQSSISAGWRSEVAQRLQLEVAVGTSKVDAGVEEDDVSFQVRSTYLLSEDRAIQFGIVRGPEAAAVADVDYKTATRLLARYSHKVNDRWSWSLNLKTEGSDYVRAGALPDYSLGYLSFGGGLRRELGSPGRAHGRLYVTFAYENRTGAESFHDYSRLRIFAGAAFVR